MSRKYNKKEFVIHKYSLQPLPKEGGYFRQVHKSADEIEVPKERYGNGKRSISTAIYYLLGKDDFSAWHCLKSEEHWTYVGGTTLTLRLISPNGEYSEVLIGPPEMLNTVSLFSVPKDTWFSASINAENEDDYTLVTCIVAPGFEFHDFEIGNRDQLIEKFPEYADVIARFARINEDSAIESLLSLPSPG